MIEKPFDPSKPIIVAPPAPDFGKKDSSKNALRHGCCAVNTMILATENEQDFKALETTWLKAYTPANDLERHLVQELINADWLLQRVTRAHANLEAQLYQLSPNTIDWTEQQERKLGRHLRYKTAQLNIVNKCRKAVEDYRRARRIEKTDADKMTLAQERLKIAKQNARPQEKNWKDHLKDMRNQAINMGFTPPEMPNPMKR